MVTMKWLRAAMMIFAATGCGSETTEQSKAGAGYLMLEYDEGPPPQFERNSEEWFTAKLKMETTEAVEAELRAAVHGEYGSSGLVEDFNCLKLADRQAQDVMEPIDAGDTVTLEGTNGNIIFHRAFDKYGKMIYKPEAMFGDFLDPVLAAPGSPYQVQLSGSELVAAQTLPAVLNMPAKISGDTPTALKTRPGISFTRGQDYELRWVPQDGVERVFIRFHTREGAPVTVCLVPDTGSYVLPSAVIAGHPDIGNLAIGYLYESSTQVTEREFQLIGSTCAFGPYTID